MFPSVESLFEKPHKACLSKIQWSMDSLISLLMQLSTNKNSILLSMNSLQTILLESVVEGPRFKYRRGHLLVSLMICDQIDC